jgi:hypothetical protein
MTIATTIGPLWEELLTRGLLFRAVSGSQATPRRAIIAVLAVAIVFSLAHFDKDWVGRMWAFANRLGIRLDASGVTLDDPGVDCPPVSQHNCEQRFPVDRPLTVPATGSYSPPPYLEG